MVVEHVMAGSLTALLGEMAWSIALCSERLCFKDTASNGPLYLEQAKQAEQDTTPT